MFAKEIQTLAQPEVFYPDSDGQPMGENTVGVAEL
jgi:hypothetical protein